MARNDYPSGPTSHIATNKVTTAKAAGQVGKEVCSNCGAFLEPVANRLFLMYKRARLPQPRAEAWVCSHCGWVEGDEQFQALLEERINHR